MGQKKKIIIIILRLMLTFRIAFKRSFFFFWFFSSSFWNQFHVIWNIVFFRSVFRNIGEKQERRSEIFSNSWILNRIRENEIYIGRIDVRADEAKVLMEMKVSVTGKYRINEIKFGYLKTNLIFDTMSREMKVRAEISVEF